MEDTAAQDIIYVEDESLRHGFTQIPNVILRRPDLPPGAKLTYMALLSYAWQQGSCFPGQDTLAADLGVSRRSLGTYLQELKAAGLLRVKRRGLGQTNIYTLTRLGTHVSTESRGRRAKIAHQEVQNPTHQEVQILHTKKTQEEQHAGEQDSAISSNAPAFGASPTTSSRSDDKAHTPSRGDNDRTGSLPTGSRRSLTSVAEVLAGRPAPAAPRRPHRPRRSSIARSSNTASLTETAGKSHAGGAGGPLRGASGRARRPRQSAVLRAVVAEISEGLNDRSPASSVTRALRLFEASGLNDEGAFAGALYQAASVVRQQPRVRRGMPYLFVVLQQLIERSRPPAAGRPSP